MGPVTLVAENRRVVAPPNNNNNKESHHNHRQQQHLQNGSSGQESTAPQTTTNAIQISNGHHVNLLPEIDILSAVPLHCDQDGVNGDDNDVDVGNKEINCHNQFRINARARQDLVIVNHNGINQTPKCTKEQSIQADLTHTERKRIHDTLQALAITVQHFTRQFQLESISKFKARAELEELKAEHTSTICELDNLRTQKSNLEVDLKRERDSCEKTTATCTENLERLRDELTRVQNESSAAEQRHHQSLTDLERQLEQRRKELHFFREEHRQELARLVSDHELEISRLRAQLDSARANREQSSLQAEVESLRTVLEIRCQETLGLRTETDRLRRELDDKEILKMRLESVEARCEDLDAQLRAKEVHERQLSHDNEVLTGQYNQLNKQIKRLSQKNEELYWKLRSRNDNNHLSGQPLASPRLSRSMDSDQGAGQSKNHDNTRKSESNSMMKFMVEKDASVSWTLDITENSLPDSRNDSNNSSRKLYHTANGGSPVSRQSSLRLSSTSKRPKASPNRTRSHSVSMEEEMPKEDAVVKSSFLSPKFKSTPIPNRAISRIDKSLLMTNDTITESSSVNSKVLSVDNLKVHESENIEISGDEKVQAMIAEEISVFSSEDEYSGSSDIP